MELIRPADVYLDEVTKTMLNDLAELAHRGNEVRPLAPDVLRQVRDELFGEQVFSSNAIEGNTLTIRETRLILQAKKIFDFRRKREAQEAINLGAAIEAIEKIHAKEGDWHDVASFLSVHEILMKGVNDSIAGLVRHHDVMIVGARRQPPGSSEASDLLDVLFKFLVEADGVSGFVLATWAHWAIARVHPFEDGNGRMARLWQDLILLRSSLTVAIIRPQDRQAYLDSLALADEGDFNPLLQLVCQRVMSTFQTYLNAQEASDELQGWAAELVGEVSVVESEKRRIAYFRWRNEVEKLRDAFERCAALISRGANPTQEVQVQIFDIIEESTWENLRSGGAAKKTWFFKVWFRQNHRIVWYYFFFGKHFWSPADSLIPEEGQWVTILVSQQRPNEDRAVMLGDLESTPISLRELLVVDKRIIRGRRDGATSKMVYDLDMKAIDVAKEFFQEVLLTELV
jgi:fido (protein-threonine AMPylation protein)